MAVRDRLDGDAAALRQLRNQLRAARREHDDHELEMVVEVDAEIASVFAQLLTPDTRNSRKAAARPGSLQTPALPWKQQRASQSPGYC